MGFFTTNEKTIENGKEIGFKDKEVVKFKVMNLSEDEKNELVKIETVLKSGDFIDKKYNIIISGKDTPGAAKGKLRFLRCFWKDEDIKTGNIKPSFPVNRFFQARANVWDARDGKTITNWYDWKDLGEDTTPATEPVASNQGALPPGTTPPATDKELEFPPPGV